MLYEELEKNGLRILSIPLNGFQKLQAKILQRGYTILSIPLNGFLQYWATALAGLVLPFNSIEWIHRGAQFRVDPRSHVSFNSIEWIPSTQPLGPRALPGHFQFH